MPASEFPLPDWGDTDLVPAVKDRLSSATDPSALLELLRGDVDLAIAVAEADTRPSLRTWFAGQGIERAETEPWRADSERTGPIGPSSVGVEWTWTGDHRDETFNGIAPTGRAVVVRGFTLFSVEDGGFAVRRYVDWAGVFAQLGLTLNWRSPVSSE